jgi:hypothetical protein
MKTLGIVAENSETIRQQRRVEKAEDGVPPKSKVQSVPFSMLWNPLILPKRLQLSGNPVMILAARNCALLLA